MKKTLKALLVMTGAVLAATVVQANPTPVVGTTYGSTEVGSGAATGVNFNITSVATVSGSGYLYSYTVPAVGSLPGTGIDSFTVHFLDTLGVTSINSPGVWSGNLNPANVSWTSFQGQDTVVGETFSFFSPYAPIWGYASAQDNGQWSDYAALLANGTLTGTPPADDGVVVPNSPSLPDGGLTVTLLGGALLGLGALRRKLGC